MSLTDLLVDIARSGMRAPAKRLADKYNRILPSGRVIEIKTHFDYPPIPVRSCDWSAVDDRTYDGEGCPIGRGGTEDEAIADLIEQLEDE